MEGQRGGRELQTARNFSRRKPFRSSLDEQTKYGETRALSESGKTGHSDSGFHVSMIIEMLNGKSRVVNMARELGSAKNSMTAVARMPTVMSR